MNVDFYLMILGIEWERLGIPVYLTTAILKVAEMCSDKRFFQLITREPFILKNRIMFTYSRHLQQRKPAD